MASLWHFLKDLCCCDFVQSFFGFGQSADIDIVLEGQDTRKTAEIKSEDGKKEKYYLYFDGETVTGKVCCPNLYFNNYL